MCGIAGYFSTSDFFSHDELKVVNASLSHRGPDAEGIFNEGPIALAHRRLSILDLSENANQPMFSADGRYAMVYNGEVYNYAEIAAELKQTHTIDFKTSSDSEVILETYAALGPSCVKKFNGMFAIAIYDRHKKELFVARDRVGIKPFHYYWDGQNFAFASEIQALKKFRNIPNSLDYHSIYKFLHLGFIPAPASIYSSIKKLESGTYAIVRENHLEHTTYWNLFEEVKPDLIRDPKKALVRLSELLMSSVQYQIRSDVPFGVFLSGGIDSSLITANAVNLSGVKVNTFSIGFEENKYNESVYAKKIAEFLGTNHHEFIVSEKNALELIDTIFDAYSEPFADSSAIPTMLVSKLAQQHVKVTLSGEGGDELFMGYGSYTWAKRLNNPFIKANRNLLGKTFNALGKKYERYSRYFKYPDEFLQYSHILSQEQYLFSLEELRSLMSEGYWKKNPKIYLEQFNNFAFDVAKCKRKLNAQERQAMFDLNFYLQDDLLTKIDRASMHFSIESRVPYLDHRLIEFSMNLSPGLKVSNGTQKYLLKELLYQYVPKKFFDRPKQGFAIPLQKWLKNELSFLIDEYLSERMIKKFDIVDYSMTRNLIDQYKNQDKDYLYNRIWNLIVLHKWLEKNHS